MLINPKQSFGHVNEEKFFHALFARLSQGDIVEIGVLNGETSEILASNAPNQFVYGVDPLIPDSMDAKLIGSLEKIKKVEADYDNYQFIQDYSTNFIKDWDKWKFGDRTIGYLFIDGDHTYEAVKKDLEDWYKYVLPGGFIGIHDSAANRGAPPCWDGPSKLADEMMNDPRFELVITVFRLTIFRVV